MTDSPQAPALEVILVDEEVWIGRGYTSSPQAREAALEMLERLVREAVGGTVPPGWRDSITYAAYARGLRVRASFQAIKHEHRIGRRYIIPGMYHEVCLVPGCDYEGPLVDLVCKV